MKPNVLQAIDDLRHMVANETIESFDIASAAPSTDAELFQHWSQSRRLCIFAGGSETSIFGSAILNYRFRALHDRKHIDGSLSFDCIAESRVCELQVMELFSRFGYNDRTAAMAKLIDLEINGQCSYFEQHNDFVADQLNWTIQNWSDYNASY